jgi:AcrR family transcriptional regulator
MDEAKSGALPPELERLWGRRERPRRGPRPGLSLEAILTAAIDLADREGLSAVSMSRLAGQLGFTTMSLYRYVSNKDELLLLMLNAAAAVEPPTRHANESWRPALERWGRANYDALVGHPWMMEVVTRGSPLTPSQLHWVDRGLDALRDTGLTAIDKAAVIRLVTVYTLGEARLSVDLAWAARNAKSEPLPWSLPLAPGFLSADDYPALVENIAAGGFGGPDGGDEADFEFGLARVLDGVESLIATNAPPA